MKLKLKVSKKDLAVFIGFSFILLYLCAIGVLNVVNLINENEIYGLNPVEAFSGKYIFGTLFIFFIVEVAIFLSVSSSIFERSKGGLGLDFSPKSSDGYSRWCTEKEMKKAPKIVKCGVKDPTADAAGVVFINNGKEMWVDNSENHTLVIGVTGSGKTTAVVDPLIYSLCKHGESMVITDPKGEIYKNHSELLRGTGYDIIVLNFRNPNLGNAWNPLTLPYRLYKEGNVDKSIELLDDVSQNIAADPKAQDPFWGRSSADYFAGCALGLFEDAKEEEVNINSISYMTTKGEDRCGAGSTFIKEYFTMKGEETTPYVFASNTINAPGDTKGGILSTFRQKIRVFATKKDLSEMLSYSDFDMRDIGKKKTAVFMVIHDEKTTYHALATIFIKQCYETLISVAQENGGPLPVRTNFILDEFANMPALKDVTTMVTAARSRQIRFTFIIQNFAQLNDVYGKDDAETIRSNCGNLMYLLTTELAALEEISKLCGEVKSKKDDKTASVPLVTVSDLQKMKFNEVIILRNRSNPFRTQLKQGFNTDWGDSQYGKADFYERQPKEVKLFDVNTFVKLRKDSKKGKEGPDALGGFGGGGFGGGFAGLSAGSSAPKDPFAGIPGLGGLASQGLASAGSSSGPSASALSGLGLPQSSSTSERKIPTFEEFLAARNKKEQETKKPGMPSFNVDELVKKIDAKIAEIEAQEKAEEEAKRRGGLGSGGAPISTPAPKETPFTPFNKIDTTSDSPMTLNPFANYDPKDMPFEEKISNKPSDIQEITTDNITPVVESKVEEDIKPINKPFEPFKPAESIKPVEQTQTVETVKPVEPKKTITSFADLMNQAMDVPQPKPSVMIENPIDETPSVPVMPTEPIINKPINDLTEMNVHNTQNNAPIASFNDLINAVKPTEQVQNKPVTTFNNLINNNNQTNNPKVVQTGVKTVNVDTTAQVVPPVTDDQFFDDFFEE